MSRPKLCQSKLRLALWTSLLLFCGCQTTPPREDVEPDAYDEDITTQMSGVVYQNVPERFLSALTPEDNVDSPASWQPGDGSTWVLATGKESDQLLVYDGDSGALLRRVAGSGSGAGQLERPNGIFVHADLALVVERDNRRVQVFSLPGFEPLGSFGQTELQKPYGLWLRPLASGLEVTVSDAYMDPQDEDRVPALAQLDQRYKRYTLTRSTGGIEVSYAGSFGATDPAGAIRVPESLWGDVHHQRMLLAEEDVPTGTRLRVYDLAGRYAGRDLGADLFRAQAEGIALWACADGSGYWIATDQYKDRSVFHLFDRVDLRHLGAFAGQTTSNTDGVWLQQGPTRNFPAGVFYAIHDDQGLAAFDWRDIAGALNLRTRCE
jgi:3-phytase